MRCTKHDDHENLVPCTCRTCVVRKFHGAVGRNDEMTVVLEISRNPGIVNSLNTGAPARHHGETPLFRAIRTNRVKMIQVLVNNGADLEQHCKNTPPLHAALTVSEGLFGNECRPVHDDVTKILLRNCDLVSLGGGTEMRGYLFGNWGGTIYHSLSLAENNRCNWNYSEIFRIIAEQKNLGKILPNINALNNKAVCALVVALYVNKSDQFINLLLEHGANVFPSDFETNCLFELRKWSSSYTRLMSLQRRAQVHFSSLVRNFGTSPTEIHLDRLPDEIWREVVGYI